MINCDCTPDTMGTYTHHINVIAPWGETVSVDACMVPELAALWRRGIRTTASCCGHKNVAGFIGGRTDADHAALDAIGYQRCAEAQHCHVARTGASSGAVPAGYALVPIEPTDAMRDAGADAASSEHGHYDCPSLGYSHASAVYGAMLAAAPEPPHG